MSLTDVGINGFHKFPTPGRLPVHTMNGLVVFHFHYRDHTVVRISFNAPDLRSSWRVALKGERDIIPSRV